MALATLDIAFPGKPEAAGAAGEEACRWEVDLIVSARPTDQIARAACDKHKPKRISQFQ